MEDQDSLKCAGDIPLAASHGGHRIVVSTVVCDTASEGSIPSDHPIPQQGEIYANGFGNTRTRHALAL
jgi:hypothetical protein